jgi:hypothetical protein
LPIECAVAHSFHIASSIFLIYRFVFSGPDKDAYFHQSFLRGKPFLCEDIERVRIKNMGSRKCSSPDTEPNFYKMPYVLNSTINTDVLTLAAQQGAVRVPTPVPTPLVLTLAVAALPAAVAAFPATVATLPVCLGHSPNFVGGRSGFANPVDAYNPPAPMPPTASANLLYAPSPQPSLNMMLPYDTTSVTWWSIANHLASQDRASIPTSAFSGGTLLGASSSLATPPLPFHANIFLMERSQNDLDVLQALVNLNSAAQTDTSYMQDYLLREQGQQDPRLAAILRRCRGY